MKTKNLDNSVKDILLSAKCSPKNIWTKILEEQNFRVTENKIYFKSYIPLPIPLQVEDWWGNYW